MSERVVIDSQIIFEKDISLDQLKKEYCGVGEKCPLVSVCHLNSSQGVTYSDVHSPGNVKHTDSGIRALAVCLNSNSN